MLEILLNGIKLDEFAICHENLCYREKLCFELAHFIRSGMAKMNLKRQKIYNISILLANQINMQLQTF